MEIPKSKLLKVYITMKLWRKMSVTILIQIRLLLIMVYFIVITYLIIIILLLFLFILGIKYEDRQNLNVITLFEENIIGLYILYYNNTFVGLKCEANYVKIIYDASYSYPIYFNHLNIIQICLQVKNVFINEVKVAKVTKA